MQPLLRKMHRYFAKNIKGSVEFEKEELAHMNVARIKEGEEISAIYEGEEYLVKVNDVREQSFELISKIENEAEPKTKVSVYQAYPKSAKLDGIIQKCVELGAYAFFPFISARCIKKPEGKNNRLEGIAKSAVKQCGRVKVPEISEVLSEKQVLEMIKKHEIALILYENESGLSLKKALEQSNANDIAIIIGPEGGFDESEVEKFIEAGAKSVSLGKRILRTETAAPAALTAIMFYKDEMN